MDATLTNVFRHRPKVGIGLGAVLLCLGVGGFVSEYLDYRTLGKNPQELTIEQAVPTSASVPDSPRFVRLAGGLTPDCSQVLEERSGASGDVTLRVLLASDAAHERWFYIRLKGDANCESASGPMVGILQKADPGLPAWLKDRGIVVPASSYPLMDMSVGDGPGDIMLLLWISGGMGLIGLTMILYIVRLKPASAVRSVAEANGPIGPMGKLLFVQSSRAGGIIGLVFCFGLIVGGVWAAVSGTYAGILVVPVGLFLGKIFLKAVTLKCEIYEQGFVSKSAFGGVSGRYGELKSISRGAVQTNFVLITNIGLVTQSGAKAALSMESIGQNDKMGQLLNYACLAMANTWMKILQRQNEVVWVEKDSTPILKIRKDGVLVKEKTGLEGFIPFSQFRVKPGFALKADIFNGDKKVVTVSTGAPNYFVGETLIAMLIENQRRPAVANSMEAVAR